VPGVVGKSLITVGLRTFLYVVGEFPPGCEEAFIDARGEASASLQSFMVVGLRVCLELSFDK